MHKILSSYVFYTAGHARKLHLKLRHHMLISSILSIIGRFKTIIYRILDLYSIRYTDTIIDLYRCFGIGCPTLIFIHTYVSSRGLRERPHTHKRTPSNIHTLTPFWKGTWLHSDQVLTRMKTCLQSHDERLRPDVCGSLTEGGI